MLASYVAIAPVAVTASVGIAIAAPSVAVAVVGKPSAVVGRFVAVKAYAAAIAVVKPAATATTIAPKYPLTVNCC